MEEENGIKIFSRTNAMQERRKKKTEYKQNKAQNKMVETDPNI